VNKCRDRIGAEPEISGRGADALGGRERGRVDSPEIGREDADQHQAKEQCAADRDRRMIAQKLENTAADFHRQQQIRQLRRDDNAMRHRYSAGGRDSQ
jgi:hypothetical protein